jgi:hypothetical protein
MFILYCLPICYALSKLFGFSLDCTYILGKGLVPQLTSDCVDDTENKRDWRKKSKKRIYRLNGELQVSERSQLTPLIPFTLSLDNYLTSPSNVACKLTVSLCLGSGG